jgi:N-acetylmuramoyl-L-alanine amidase
MASRRMSRAALVTLVFLAGCTSGLRIHDRPIVFSQQRERATLEYIATHYGIEAEDIVIVPQMIVLHWTGIDDLEESFAAFDPEQLGDDRPELDGAGQVNVSIQFLVAQDGAIYRLMPETWMARHVIGLNHSAIGIENVGGGQSIDNLSDEQIAANIRLVRDLVGRYPTIRFLIGHMEYRRFEGGPLWRELDASYRTEKLDPGKRFMSAVRAGVADLRLAGPP